MPLNDDEQDMVSCCLVVYVIAFSFITFWNRIGKVLETLDFKPSSVRPCSSSALWRFPC